MEFPRIKPFTFNIKTSYVVPAHHVGRLDLISLAFYDNVRYYKVIAASNNINLSYGVRAGIRLDSVALRNELIMKGFRDNALEVEYQRIMDKNRDTAFDWYAYDNNSYGYISDVYEGKFLFIPDNASADLYLQQYEYLSGN